ncbi:hypothetical protein OH77DRAFT_707344 [Trametes cingulata]|nr:hypothetical protein OH77DRAFT_707344 [Trametes cingulata]
MRAPLRSLAFVALAINHDCLAAVAVLPDSGQPAPPRKLNTYALRHGSVPRHMQDTCLYLNSTTLSDMDIPGLSTELPSDLESCMCARSLPDLIATDAQLAYVTDTLGTAGAEQVFESLVSFISSSALSQKCTYPANSQPLCTRENVCGFVCNAPFTAVGDTCVCVDSSGCAPVHRTSLKVRLHKRASINTLAAAQSTCGTHETVCGTYGRANRIFQCVDVGSSLDNCGGCMVPNPFADPSSGREAGVDCSAVPHVADVSCVSGTCAVRSCRAGWTVNDQGTGCVESSRTTDTYLPDVSRQSYHSTRLLVKGFRRSEASHGDMDEHTSEAGRIESLWRIPDIRFEKKLEEGWVRIPDIRSEERTDPDSGSTQVAPKKIQEDWVRIPDIRRTARE